MQSFDGTIDYRGTVRVPLLEDAVLISIPRLVAGAEGAVEPFRL